MRLEAITDMHVQCALRVGNFNEPGFAMSDCCQRPATGGVVMEDGSVYWRCTGHQGLRDYRTGELGNVVSHVVRRDI